MSKFLTFIAVEDQPSLSIVRKIVEKTDRFEISKEFPTSGFGYLKKNMKAFNKLAQNYVVIVITDIDNKEINPDEFKQKWINIQKNTGLVFELAIVEIESWILADNDSFKEFFHVSTTDTSATDDIPDPKKKLIEVVKKSRSKDIRAAIIPNAGASIGPEYNITLMEYVTRYWDEERARINSDSLDHFLKTLENFEDNTGQLITIS